MACRAPDGDPPPSSQKRPSLMKRDEHDALVSRLKFLEDLTLPGHDFSLENVSVNGHPLDSDRKSTERSFSDWRTPPPDMSDATPGQLVEWYLREQETLARIAGASSMRDGLDRSHMGDVKDIPTVNIEEEEMQSVNDAKNRLLGKRKASLESPADLNELNAVSSRDVVRDTVLLYLGRVNGHLSVLHAGQFMERVDRYLANHPNSFEPDQPSNVLEFSKARDKTRLVIDAAVAFVVANGMQSRTLPYIEALGGWRNFWRRTCNITLLEAWSRPSLEVVQALVILAFGSVTERWISLKHWNIIGTAARLSVLIGLNRESNLKIAAGPSFVQDTLPTHFLPPPADPLDAELRRRIFWSIFLIDRIGASATGWTFSLNRRDHGVDLPGLDDWDVVSPNGLPCTEYTGDMGDRFTGRGRVPRGQSSFRFPPAGRVAQEIEAPHPEFRWSAASVQEDERDDDRTPLSLLVESAEGLGHVQVFLAEPINPANADAQLLALVQLDRRLETWYDQLPDQYRIDRALPSTPAPLCPNVVLMLGVYHIAIIMLHQAIAYTSTGLSSMVYPNAIRRCRDSYGSLIRVFRSLSPEQVARQHPLSSYCIYVLGRALCLHSRHRMDGPARETSSNDDQLGVEIGLCLELLDKLGASWGCAVTMADSLRRGLDAIKTPELAQTFYDPRAVPLAAINGWI